MSRSRASQNTPQNQLKFFPLSDYPWEKPPHRRGEEKGFAWHGDTALETLNDRGKMGRNQQ